MRFTNLQQQQQQQQHRQEVAHVEEEPWLRPCGTPIGAAGTPAAAAVAATAIKIPPRRHSVHRALKRVKTQLRVAQNHFRTDLEDIHDIYSKVYKVLKEQQYRMNWLPIRQLEWYHREVWCLDKGKKAERTLPRLHDALQRFAITFHHLRVFKLKSNINVDVTMIRRNNIIDGMKSEILRMLCEVETAILNLGLQLPVTLHSSSILVAEKSNWAREGDLTLMLIQDSGVLRLYQIWLNEWIRALRNATATGSGTCDSSKLRPLTSLFKPKKLQREDGRGQRKRTAAAARREESSSSGNKKKKRKKLERKVQQSRKNKRKIAMKRQKR